MAPSLKAPEGHGATFVELFFDLVFVFAVTQVTHYAAAHFTVEGVLRAGTVFWLVWWAWTQFTWALNTANADHPEIRIGTLLATAVAFAMAASVEGAFAERALWFALPYVGVRLLGLGLYWRIATGDPGQQAAVRRFMLASLFGLGAVVVGGVVDPGPRQLVWLLAIALDVMAAGIGTRRAEWRLQAGHFAERHGLFVIIALGESLILAGSAVAAEERTPALITAGGLAVLVTCLLWWSYFGWAKDRLEAALEGVAESRQAPMARDAFSLLHFLVIGGIVGFSVGVEGLLHHPSEALAPSVVVALLSGIVLFCGGTALSVYRASGAPLLGRWGVLLVLVAVAGLASIQGWGGLGVMGIVAAGLGVLVLIEGTGPPGMHPDRGRTASAG